MDTASDNERRFTSGCRAGSSARRGRRLRIMGTQTTFENLLSSISALWRDQEREIIAGARTRQPENSKRAHFRAPALQKHQQNSTNGTPKREKEEENCGGTRAKKERNFGPPTLRAPTLRGLHPSGLHPSGPPPFGAPTFGPNLRGPHFFWVWAPPFGAPLFLGLGFHPWGLHPVGTTHFVVQKFNI